MGRDGHRLVLFDVDGTLLSVGPAARESILESLREIFGTDGRAEGYDFSGKTDPQIVRELLEDLVPVQHLEARLPSLLARYLEILERRLRERPTVEPKAGVPELLERLSADGRATLGLLTGNLERGARLKLEPLRLNSYFAFGAFGSDADDRRKLPAIAVARARQAVGRRFRRKQIAIVGDSIHDIRCGRSLGAKAVAVASGVTPMGRLAAEAPDFLFPDFSDVDAALEAILE